MGRYESRFTRVVLNKYGKKIYFDQMSSHEIEERVKECDIVIVPCGSIECHGPHAPVGEDSFIGAYIAERVAYETGVTVAPPIWYGSHPSHHYGMIGTIPIENKQTYIDYVRSVCKWLIHSGFKKVLILNSHGQEYVLPIVKDDLIVKDRVKALIMVTSWWSWVRDLLAKVGEEIAPGVKFETPFIHADEVETSVMWYIGPDLIDKEKLKKAKAEKMVGVLKDKQDVYVDKAGNVFGKPFGWYDISQLPEVKYYPVGVVGDATKADPKKGEVLIETCIKRMIEFI
ncbi:MAG: hypothetical protein DRM97_05105, partial [Thermoprotei archaeon]